VHVLKSVLNKSHLIGRPSVSLVTARSAAEMENSSDCRVGVGATVNDGPCHRPLALERPRHSCACSRDNGRPIDDSVRSFQSVVSAASIAASSKSRADRCTFRKTCRIGKLLQGDSVSSFSTCCGKHRDGNTHQVLRIARIDRNARARALDIAREISPRRDSRLSDPNGSANTR